MISCRSLLIPSLLGALLVPAAGSALDLPRDMSKETAECVRCHRELSPGIVHDWARSRHAWTRPETPFERPAATRRISAVKAPEAFAGKVVGCFECHGQSPDQRPDAFDHMGYKIHTVVTPKDCQACHPVEVGEFSRSKKAFALENLEGNPLYAQLADALSAEAHKRNGSSAAPRGGSEKCGGCHGARVSVVGWTRVLTATGEIDVPQLSNWPNQGIGRINPDGSRGACSACHGRHAFAVEDARHPEACVRCHSGGHSPAREAYEGSAHGGLYRAREPEFDWSNGPWVVGQDFTVPTCAACHMSQLAGERGSVLARGSHDAGSRLWIRLLGLPFSHPQPRDGDTRGLRNGDGLPLPTGLDGAPAAQGLLTPVEQVVRRASMAAVCAGCHSRSLVEGHFQALELRTGEADGGAGAATALVRSHWSAGRANPSNPFDEAIEQLWVEVWFLRATATRYAAAMAGGWGLGGDPMGQRNRPVEQLEKVLPPSR